MSNDGYEGAIDRVKWFVHRHVRLFAFMGALVFFSMFAMSSLANSLVGPDQVLREFAIHTLMLAGLFVGIFAVNMAWAEYMGDCDDE